MFYIRCESVLRKKNALRLVLSNYRKVNFGKDFVPLFRSVNSNIKCV